MTIARLTPTEAALFETTGPRGARRIRIITTAVIIALACLLSIALWRFYAQGQLEWRLWQWIADPHAWRFLAKGLLGSLASAAGAGAIGVVAALVVMAGRLSTHAWARIPARVFIECGRGIPTLLLIYFMFTVPGSFGITISAYWQITIPVAIYATAVLAEIYRAGVAAVPQGQKEAAYALGLTRFAVYRHVVLPQAFTIVVPTMVSQLVVVVKDTTFGYVVSYTELMKQAEVLRSTFHTLLPVYLIVALVYIGVNYGISRCAHYLASRHSLRIDVGVR